VGKYPTFNCRQLERRLHEIGCEHLRNTGITRIHFALIASSPFRGIPAMCRAASLRTSSKTSASRGMNSISGGSDFRPRIRDITSERLALVKTSDIQGLTIICGQREPPFHFIRLMRVHPVVKSRPLRLLCLGGF
jgi:hypothetical protein